MRKFSWFKWALIIGSCLVVIFIVVANVVVSKRSNPYIFSNVSRTPETTFALLLGTSKTGRNGKSNAYFDNRITAIQELYEAHKIKYVLISGDNGRKTYNEPKDMRDALVNAGIPVNKIFLDYAGFSTVESVVRAKEVFGLKHFLIVSQKFHTQRAVYLARVKGIQATGYCAKDVNKMGGFLTTIREYFARVKVFTDIWFNVQPTYLGEKIALPKA